MTMATTFYQLSKVNSLMIIVQFIAKRQSPNSEAKTICHLGRAKLPMILGHPTNLMRGIKANGSCTLWRIFK